MRSSEGGSRPHVRIASLQWLAAWAVLLHALLARFDEDGSFVVGLMDALAGSRPTISFLYLAFPVLATFLAEAALFAILGLLLRTSPVSFEGDEGATRTQILGAIALPVAGLGLHAYELLATGGETPRPFLLAPWIGLLVLLLIDAAAWRRVPRLVNVELTKMLRSRVFLGGLGAVAGLTLLAAVTHESLPGETGWTLAAASLGTGLWGAEVFLLVLGAVTLAGEATGGTLKMMIPHAYRRSDWIIAKGLVLLVVSVFFLDVVLVVSLGHAHLTQGLGDVTREIEESFTGEAGGVETFRTASVMASHLDHAIVAGLAALVATGLLGLFLSSVFDNVVAALCVAFLLFAGLKFADVVWSLPRETLLGFYTWYPGELRELTSKLGRALNERWDDALLGAGLRLSLLSSVLATLLATAAFTRRDLHS